MFLKKDGNSLPATTENDVQKCGNYDIIQGKGPGQVYGKEGVDNISKLLATIVHLGT